MASPPTFLKGFPGPRGHPDPQNDRFPILIFLREFVYQAKVQPRKPFQRGAVCQLRLRFEVSFVLLEAGNGHAGNWSTGLRRLDFSIVFLASRVFGLLRGGTGGACGRAPEVSKTLRMALGDLPGAPGGWGGRAEKPQKPILFAGPF